ncbi:TPA: hypothetical protein ACHU7H_001444 [Streptococcus suis]|nr:hypothetical protein [Streptococcus suis]
MTKNTQLSQERNKKYFQSFIATRASMGMIGFAGIVGAFVGGINYLLHTGTVVYYGVTPPQDILSQILICSNVFLVLSILLNFVEPIRRFFYKHQRFSSIWQFLSVFLMYFMLIVLSAILTLANKNMLDIYGSPFSLPFLVGGIALYSLCIAYNIDWLKKELEKGMSEERTQKNYLSSLSNASLNTLLIMFGLVMIAPLIFKGTLMTGIGLATFVLFTGAFSRLHVEYAYAAVLKWRDKEYWEEYRREDGIIIPKKKWLFMIRLMVEAGVLFGIIYLGLKLNEQNNPLEFPLRLATIGILIYWIIRIILWKIRKNKEKQKG